MQVTGEYHVLFHGAREELEGLATVGDVLNYLKEKGVE